MDAEGGCRDGPEAEGPQGPGARRRGGQAPKRLYDHGQDHRLDAPEQPRRLGKLSEAHVRPGEGAGQQHGRQDEARSRHDQPGPAAARPADVNRHLGRVGPRNEVRRAEQIQEVLVGQPASAVHDLVSHHGDVRGWATEGGGAQPQEEPGQLRQRGRRRRLVRQVLAIRRHVERYITRRERGGPQSQGVPGGHQRRGFGPHLLGGGGGRAVDGKKPKGGDVPPTEDLMREHGVLRRILLIYDEAARRLVTTDAAAVGVVVSAANIVHRFVEGYHEKLEEQFVFPKMEKAGAEAAGDRGAPRSGARGRAQADRRDLEWRQIGQGAGRSASTISLASRRFDRGWRRRPAARHFQRQLRTSGRSSPCLRMYCRWSISLSRSCCLR